jgi:cell division protein FtsW
MTIPFRGNVAQPSRVRRVPRTSRAEAGETVVTHRSATRAAKTVHGVRGWTPLSLGLLSLIATLAAVGLVFVASSSSIYSLHRFGSSWYLLQKQVIFVGLGLLAMCITMLLPYRIWKVLGMPALVLSMVGVFLTFTSLGVSRNGSSRWIGPEFLQFQPSELVKFGLAATMALGLSKIEGHPDEQRKIRNQMLVMLGLVVAPILVQPDMGTAMILVAIVASMVVATGLPLRVLSFYAATGFVVATIVAIVEPYRRDRVLAFLSDKDPSGIGYHVHQSKMGFASGHLWGTGIGASKAKWGFLPNSYTDFIYAVIGEELGLVGATLVLAAFLIIASVGTRIARRIDDRFGALFAIGITTWIVAQAVVNMGAVIGTMPVTGVPLPFISKGGSSFVVLTAAAGVLINMARHTRRVEPFAARRRARKDAVIGGELLIDSNHTGSRTESNLTNA